MRTLRNFIKRAKMICSNEILLNEELKYQMKIFHKVNNYPMSMTNKIVQQEF